MPPPDQILAGLSEIANGWRTLAMAWHVYYGILTVVVLGARPSRRVVGSMMAVPLLSVSALAWIHENPFNGMFFAVLTISLFTIAGRLSAERIRLAPAWMVISGAVMLLFGWVYPHFLEQGAVWSYLYAAPTGLLPCPTLSASIGVALAANGIGSRAYLWVMGIAGVFYGLFGAVRLGVLIDIVLLFGATAIIVASLRLNRAALDAS